LNQNLNVRTLQAHTDSVICLEVLSLKEKEVISGSKDKLIKIWNLETGVCRQNLHGHSSWIWCLKVLVNEERLASGSTDACVKIWNLENGSCMFTLELHTAAILCLEQLGNGFLLSGSSDTSIRMWSLNESTMCRKTVYFDYTSSVTCLKRLKGF
jgi:WD40 repeat protein